MNFSILNNDIIFGTGWKDIKSATLFTGVRPSVGAIFLKFENFKVTATLRYHLLTAISKISFQVLFDQYKGDDHCQHDGLHA